MEWRVYEDPNPDAPMTWKGPQFKLGPGIVYAPYIPDVFRGRVPDPDVELEDEQPLPH
jgi:hypothetical protein